MKFRKEFVLAGAAVIIVAGIAVYAIAGSDSDVDTEDIAVPTTLTTTTTSTSTSIPSALAAREALTADEPGQPLQPQGGLGRLAEIDGPFIATTTTTTTIPPVPITAAPATGPAAIAIPVPNCAAGLGVPGLQIAPFTGLEATIPVGLPAVVVKVSNNSSKSRAALIGLDQADVVFEERIEASATRFASVFHSSLPPNVGPVRSGRTTDIQILRNLGSPVLGYSGSNAGVASQFASAAANGWFTPVINTDRAPFARDSRYTAPDNLFVDPASLGACGTGGTPSSIFTYGPETSSTTEPASSVSLQARSPYRFDWQPSSGTWLRSQDGTAHRTRTGEALDPHNVVVLFVRYVPSAIDRASVDAETIGSGQAWMFRDGVVTVGSWSRTRATDGYNLTDGNGALTTLKPGSTWVVLAPGGSASWN